MELKDIPDLKGNRYPARISISLTGEAKAKLDALKREQQKDTAELVRMLIDNFFQELEDAG